MVVIVRQLLMLPHDDGDYEVYYDPLGVNPNVPHPVPTVCS